MVGSPLCGDLVRIRVSVVGSYGQPEPTPPAPLLPLSRLVYQKLQVEDLPQQPLQRSGAMISPEEEQQLLQKAKEAGVDAMITKFKEDDADDSGEEMDMNTDADMGVNMDVAGNNADVDDGPGPKETDNSTDLLQQLESKMPWTKGRIIVEMPEQGQVINESSKGCRHIASPPVVLECTKSCHNRAQPMPQPHPSHFSILLRHALLT